MITKNKFKRVQRKTVISKLDEINKTETIPNIEFIKIAITKNRQISKLNMMI